MDESSGGASFSFGCSWSMYFNACKFSRSRVQPKLFKLSEAKDEERFIEEKLQSLADNAAEKLRVAAPAIYHNQTLLAYKSQACRLGKELLLLSRAAQIFTRPGKIWKEEFHLLEYIQV